MNAAKSTPLLTADMGYSLIVFLFVLLFWQGTYEAVGDAGLASPLNTIGSAGLMVASPDFWPDAWGTLFPFLVAIVFETVIGIGLGVLSGLNRTVGEVVDPIAIGLYSVPKIIFYPIILLLFGIGDMAQAIFGALHGILPIILYSSSAVRMMKPVYRKTGRILKLSPARTVWRIGIPAALPEIFTGLRVGYAVTLLGVLLSEMFGSSHGLGYRLVIAIGGARIDEMMAIAVLLTAFSIGLNYVLLKMDRRLHHQ